MRNKIIELTIRFLLFGSNIIRHFIILLFMILYYLVIAISIYKNNILRFITIEPQYVTLTQETVTMNRK